ncbi:hypothetical protein HKD37_13G036235 [Glycine soja]|nr:hypothetical protein GmHk_13G037242 [Glycine max]RZB71843.1 hypothetical protein D0Y65_036309 [Glycine soja]
MEEFRSKSYGDGRMQIEAYRGTNMQDLRCYSASYASSVHPTTTQQTQMGNNDAKFKKGKSTNGSTSKSWSFSDPELQRKKRVASYKVYAVEGKLKGSLRKSFKWFKDRCNRVVYGWLPSLAVCGCLPGFHIMNDSSCSGSAKKILE